MPHPESHPREDDETIVVLCLDSASHPIPITEGSMARTCASCGTGVWLSPATATAIAGKPHELQCADCVGEAEEDDEVIAPTPGQLEEIRRAIGPDAEATARHITQSPARRAKTLEDILRRARRNKK